MCFIKNGSELLFVIFFCILSLFSSSAFSNDGDVCPIFDDYFLSNGKSDSTFSEYLKHPILEENVFGLRHISSRDNIVHIEVFEKPLIMKITVYDAKGEIKIEKIFDSNMSCNNKKIIFLSSAKGSSDGSSVQYSEMKTEFFWRNKDTLAVTTSRYSEKRSWIFFRDKSMDVVNYTFSKKF